MEDWVTTDLDKFQVNDRQLGFPEKLQSVPPGKFTRSDFHSFIFPVLSSLVSYHKYLVLTGNDFLNQNTNSHNLTEILWSEVKCPQPKPLSLPVKITTVVLTSNDIQAGVNSTTIHSWPRHHGIDLGSWKYMVGIWISYVHILNELVHILEHLDTSPNSKHFISCLWKIINIKISWLIRHL
jgi:hypothetical protein